MELIWAAIVLLSLCFGAVLLVGAPYLPTLTPQVKSALDLANLPKGAHLLELGCGDGKVLIAAAERGLKVTGYELNPLLVIVARLRTVRYENVHVIWGNFWSKRLPPADGIFVFLLPKYMVRLDKKITQEYSGKKIKLVSFAFKIPHKSVKKEQDGVFLYLYGK